MTDLKKLHADACQDLDKIDEANNKLKAEIARLSSETHCKKDESFLDLIGLLKTLLSVGRELREAKRLTVSKIKRSIKSQNRFENNGGNMERQQKVEDKINETLFHEGGELSLFTPSVPSPCPVCQKVPTGSTAHHQIPPKMGDITLCTYCSAVLTFTENGLAVFAEYDNLDDDTRKEIDHGVALIRQAHEK